MCMYTFIYYLIMFNDDDNNNIIIKILPKTGKFGFLFEDLIL